MPVLAQNCRLLCECFAKLLELSEDQAALYQGVRTAIAEKAWAPLHQNLERMEMLAREQGRVNKRILELRRQLQDQIENPEILRVSGLYSELWTISSLLPLLPEPQRAQLRSVWQELRSSLSRRRSEFQVLEQYSRGRQELIQGFLAALKDDELDRGQAYGRAGYHSAAEAPSRIFNSEA